MVASPPLCKRITLAWVEWTQKGTQNRRLAHHQHMLLPSAGPQRLAVACDSYQWSDHGAALEISVPLPDSSLASAADGAVECSFQRDAVCLTMTDGTTAQHVLRLQPLFVPVVPERCAWRLHNGCRYPVQPVTGKDSAEAGAIVVAGTQPWAVRITLCKQDPSVTWRSLIQAVSPPK